MSMASSCFWHEVLVWNETHHWTWILSSFKIFSNVLAWCAIVALIHLNLHHFWILMRWSLQTVCKLVLLLHLHLGSLLHQILSSKGHSTLKLLLHLFEIHKLALLMRLVLLLLYHIIELSNISVLNLHVILDWCSSFVVYFAVLHRFTTDKVSWGAWCGKSTTTLASVHVCEVPEIGWKILLSHFELSAILLQVLHVAM